MSTGTTLVVRQAFYNLPVRRQWLQKNIADEMNRMAWLTKGYAIQYHQVRFTFKVLDTATYLSFTKPTCASIEVINLI